VTKMLLTSVILATFLATVPYTTTTARLQNPQQQQAAQTQIVGQSAIKNMEPQSSQENAILAAKYLDGTTIEPGDIFSYNNQVGPRTEERGFVYGQSVAWTPQGFRLIPDLGGGICRTATALNLAVNTAGLKVIERHNHSIPVPYAPTGKDAAVSWGVWDYRFQNTLDKPIQIATHITNAVEANESNIHIALIAIDGN